MFDITNLVRKEKVNKNKTTSVWFEDGSGIIVAKVCSQCSSPRLLNDYHKMKNGLGGVKGSCKACSNQCDRERYKQNPRYKKEYYEENKEVILKRMRDNYRQTAN
ncbi:hypothetical protein CN613_25585 [Bacillus pseudomycoides]|uniref:Uncharacterized protein n=1 Tax=Bacillus pseudomycoides TaxID=64104 RepID=A0A2A8BYC5_9BACI|nr:hypothetical protein [Bacillus pseudomycoides]PEM65319.1 hypothetical protein CN613_25585 [Bacillus pseudomycoides]